MFALSIVKQLKSPKLNKVDIKIVCDDVYQAAYLIHSLILLINFS